MAQHPLQRILGGGGPGLPRGTSLGLKLLGTAAAIGIGINQSMYTGEMSLRSGVWVARLVTCTIVLFCE